VTALLQDVWHTVRIARRYPSFALAVAVTIALVVALKLALGADCSRIRFDVVRYAMKPAVAGAIAGMVVGAAMTKGLASLLFEIAPYDPLTFIFIPLGFLIVAYVASDLPARRASTINPMETLRSA
jgi:putative ABC transport system permease protein